MKVLTFGQGIYYIYLLLVDEYSDMEGEAKTQVDDAQKDKEITKVSTRNKKAEKEKKREATVEMTTTKKQASEMGKVSVGNIKVTAQGTNLANF